MEIGSDAIVTSEDIKEIINVKLINSNSSFWWKDLKISKNNLDYIAIEARLNVETNYKIMQMIDSYHNYVLYHDNLVKVIYNKPLSIASLNIVNDDDILKHIETLEKDLLTYRASILALENKIINMVEEFIREEKLIIVKNSAGYKTKKFLAMFKFSKHTNVIEQSLNLTYEQNKLRNDKV